MKIQAKPFEILKKAQQHFQQREMNKLRDKLKMSKMSSTGGVSSVVQPKKPTRKVFNSLTTHEAKTGLRNVSMTNSTSGTQIIPQMMLNNQPIKKFGIGKLNTTSNNKTNFKIYEENSENLKNEKKRMTFEDEFVKSKKIKTLAGEKEKKKENIGKPDKWTSHSIKQSMTSKKHVEKIQFKIFQDEESCEEKEELKESNSQLKKIKNLKSSTSLYEELRINPLKFVKK